MTDSELLLAMSELMDKKLKPIDERLERIEQTQEKDILPRLRNLEQRQKKMELTLENNVLPRLQNLEQSQRNLEQSQRNLEQSQRNLEQAQKKTELIQKKIVLTLENDVLPRLQNLESCYTSTYQRYAAGVERIDAMQADISIIKKVVTRHSECCSDLHDSKKAQSF